GSLLRKAFTQNLKQAPEGRGDSVRPVNRATLRAVHASSADTGKNGRKFPLRAAGDFRIPFVINTYKPEDQLFVSRIHLCDQKALSGA
ncbi:hypothetical protein ACMS3N_005334, partial [Escherichia coli]